MVDEQSNQRPSSTEGNQAAPGGISGSETAGEYKPNIYPILYWSIAYGVIAGVILMVVWWLSRFITLLWAPVFLIGAAWGAYRNYKKQKNEWSRNRGVAPQKKSAMDEFKEASRDIIQAGREMMAEQRAEDIAAEEATIAEQEALAAEQPVAQPPAAPPRQAPSGGVAPSEESTDADQAGGEQTPPQSRPPVPPNGTQL